MINAQIGAKRQWDGQYAVDCDTVPSLPDLTFTINGKDFPIKATDYIVAAQENSCLSSFTPAPAGIPETLWIIGESWQSLTV